MSSSILVKNLFKGSLEFLFKMPASHCARGNRQGEGSEENPEARTTSASTALVLSLHKTQVVAALCPGQHARRGFRAPSVRHNAVLSTREPNSKGETAYSLGIKYRKATRIRGTVPKAELFPHDLRGSC